MTYRHPKFSFSSQNAKSGEIANRNTFANAKKPTERVNRTGENSLRIWENMRDELVPRIVRDSQDKYRFPIATWFSSGDPAVANAFKHHGHYVGTVRRLQSEGFLPVDYIPVADLSENAEPRKSDARQLNTFENVCVYILGVCGQIGHFPKKPKEMVDAGHAYALNVIRRDYGKLNEFEALMREAGLLSSYPKSK